MTDISKKSIPLGLDDFRMLMEENYYYVDKSLMIKDFLEAKNKVTLITRPRRFGKTLNMTMLRDFFDIRQKSNRIFSGLRIMKTSYAKEMNTRPVIALSLKGCSGNTMESLLLDFAAEMRKEYVKYEEILNEVEQCHPAKRSYQRLLLALENNTFTENDLKISLCALIEILYHFYHVRPLLLIDEYDNPIIEAYQYGYRREFTSFYSTFLTNALKGNPYLGQALLTGIQRVVKESIFSKLNNVVVYHIMDERYSPYFGFTEEETRILLNYYNVTLDKKVKQYYNGYLFGKVEIYNPWSILSYADKKELRNYWVKTSTNALIHRSVEKANYDFHVDFEKLIENEEIEVNLNLEASFSELPRTDTLWGLFVNAGYLKVVDKNYEYNSFILSFPNKEIKTEFYTIVEQYTHLSSQLLQKMLLSLIRNEMDKFFDIYQKLVLEATSFHDCKEHAYHMLFLGMIMQLRDIYEISSNREGGHGRYDIQMISKCVQRPHLLIEFKQGKNVEKLKYEALQQIKKKQYYASLTGEVICIGIAHDKKRCQLVWEKLIMRD